MKKILLLFFFFCVTVSAHAFHPDNIYTIQTVERWGGSQPYNDTRPFMCIFTLRNAPTQLYTTGIITRKDWGDQYDARNYVGTPFTADNIVQYLKFSRGTHEYSNLSQSSLSGSFESKDLNGNAIPDFREYVAGGEPLYWTSCGNGWQFYVNGAMKVCNSDTNWETVPYAEVPPSVAQQYPDENHNSIPDIVDAAIAAGGGATSEGGNITVVVNNQTIPVTVNNQPVLDALQALSAKLDSLPSGGTGGSSSSGGESGSGDSHCDALQLQPTITIIQGQEQQNFYALNAILRALGYQYGISAEGGVVGLSSQVNSNDNLLTVVRDCRTLLEKIRDGDWFLTDEWKVQVQVEGLENVIQGMAEIKTVNQDISQTTGDILQHLQEIQQPTLETIATNTKNTHDAIRELIAEVKKINAGGSSLGDAPSREDADDLLDETRSGIQDKQQDYDDDDQQTEDDAEELKDYHKDKQNHGERLRKKICQLFDIDIESSHPMKPSHQETGHHEIIWYNTRPIANLTGDSSVHGKMLTQSFELDPRRFLNASETWNGEESNIMKDAYRNIVIPGMDIARTFLLFIVAWNFFGAIFDLVKETWSA